VKLGSLEQVSLPVVSVSPAVEQMHWTHTHVPLLPSNLDILRCLGLRQSLTDWTTSPSPAQDLKPGTYCSFVKDQQALTTDKSMHPG
jgi:hypothetical protein